MRHLLATALLCATPLPALADAWADISAMVWDGRPLQDGAGIVTLDAPYRTPDDARTDIALTVDAPAGLSIAEVTLVIEDNPMPVSARIRFDDPQARVQFDGTFRVNGPMPVHAVVETTDGQLFVVEQFVKTSGQGACAAPPGTDPALALETLGDMRLSAGAAQGGGATARLTSILSDYKRLGIGISHPSHSGLQKDQISLLYIPLRYVETVDIDIDGEDYATVTGSISLSENPDLGLSVPSGAQQVSVTMTDTEGAAYTAEHRFAGF